MHDGKARSANVDGVILNDWEALYAIHSVGKNENAVTYRIVCHTNNFNAPSNWLLVAVVNADDNTIKLGTGVIIAAKSSSDRGSSLPSGTILMWYGNENDVPDGWAICNGSNTTPDLRGRFVLGSGTGVNLTQRIAGQFGGKETHQLSLAEMPQHNHTINDPGHNHNWRASRQLQGIDDRSYGDELSKGDAGNSDIMSKDTDQRGTGITINNSGSNQAHENMPPFYVLIYIMKL